MSLAPLAAAASRIARGIGRVFGCQPAIAGGHIRKEYIGRFLPPAPVIVEAGAYEGGDTREMSALWPKAYIHAFEPVPPLFERLTAATRDLRNVAVYPLALGGRSGRVRMHVSKGASTASSSLRAPKQHLMEHPDTRFDQDTDVVVITLDEWAAQNGVGQVDFLWLDVQGCELDVLKAGEHVLRSVCAIHLEVCLKEMYEGVPLYPELRRWLEERGFRVLCEALPWPDMGNVLFVRHAASGSHGSATGHTNGCKTGKGLG